MRKIDINRSWMAQLVRGAMFIVCGLSLVIPSKVWMFFGRCLGRLIYRVSKKHRNIAHTNVRFAYEGEKSEEEMDRIARQSFLYLGMQALDIARATTFVLTGPECKESKISYEGLEHYNTAVASGKGVLILSAHFGAMDYANAFYAKKSGRPVNFLLRKLDNKHLQNMFTAAGKKAGIKFFYKGTGLRPVVKNVIKGEDLVVYADQGTSKKVGVDSLFFGKPTTSLPLLPSLAKKTGSPILPMFIYRQPDHVHHKIVFSPPIFATEDDTVESLTQKQNDAMENAIRRMPEQWLWVHRKWKKDYPDLYRK